MTSKSPVTTHILDLGSGTPAAGVAVALYRVDDQQVPRCQPERLLTECPVVHVAAVRAWYQLELWLGL